MKDILEAYTRPYDPHRPVICRAQRASRQCLDRRVLDRTTLEDDIAAWMVARDTRGAPIDWRFTTADARIKLHRLYPSIEA